MSRRLISSLVVWLMLVLIPMMASAQNFASCTKSERGVAEAAIRNAKALALASAASVGDTPEYARWFGKYDPAKAEVVRANLKAVFTAIRSGQLDVICTNVGIDACDLDTFAFVYDDVAYQIYLCPSFFRMPTMASLDPGSLASDDGTREGTIIHEISHFQIVARTDDNCYARSECEVMARRDPQAAIENADSYQYFSEDITYFGRSIEQVVPDADGTGGN
jgi:peptidyl-Lys metalloendopeptidase